MAEGRFISRSIATNGQLKRVSLEADYLFGRMIPHLDREGRIDGDPDVVKAMACPLRGEITSELIATCLAELDTVGLIEWYEVDGRQVAQFPAFKAHQRGMKPERERASVLPCKDAQGSKPVRRTVASGIPPAPSGVRAEAVDIVAPTLAPKLSEVKVSKEKISADAGSPKGLALCSKADCDAQFSKWGEHFGAMEYGTFRKKLLTTYQPGQPLFDLPDRLNAIEAAREWWIEQDDKDQGFFTFDKFLQQIGGKWIPFGRMGISERGELTERGAWAGSKAMRAESRRPRLA